MLAGDVVLCQLVDVILCQLVMLLYASSDVTLPEG